MWSQLIDYFVTCRKKQPDESNCEEAIWGVVANIKREHSYGPNGSKTRSGTRQFRGGTKVYISGCFAGTCESVICIGMHRISRRFNTCVVNVCHVENFRAKIVYHPKILKIIQSNPQCWIRTEDEANLWSSEFLQWQKLREAPKQ